MKNLLAAITAFIAGVAAFAQEPFGWCLGEKVLLKKRKLFRTTLFVKRMYFGLKEFGDH
jgi:hypothetical protein